MRWSVRVHILRQTPIVAGMRIKWSEWHTYVRVGLSGSAHGENAQKINSRKNERTNAFGHIFIFIKWSYVRAINLRWRAHWMNSTCAQPAPWARAPRRAWPNARKTKKPQHSSRAALHSLTYSVVAVERSGARAGRAEPDNDRKINDQLNSQLNLTEINKNNKNYFTSHSQSIRFTFGK